MSVLGEIFAFYKDGRLVHLHTDRGVFEAWLRDSAWLYPSDRCEIVRYVRESAIE